MIDIKEEFITKAKIKHNNKYDYSLVEYINCKTKVKIICNEHGEFLQTPDSHIQGKNCSKCTGNYNYTTEEFIVRSNIKHNNKYNYSLVKYNNCKDNVKIICPVHGIFEQKASNHVNNGYGCNECGKIVRGITKRRTTKEQKQDFSHIIPPKGSRIIPLTRGKYTLVDEEDYERVNQYNWNAYRGQDGRYYAVSYIEGTYYRLHRFLLNLEPYNKSYADHINGDGLNNRRNNIRLATPTQNSYNQKVQNRAKTSKYKGVSWNKGVKKWHAYIKQNQKRINLGLFLSEEEAAKAYDIKAIELFKEFSNLNFPND